MKSADKAILLGRMKQLHIGKKGAHGSGFLAIPDLREIWGEVARRKHSGTTIEHMRDVLNTYYTSPEGKAEIQRAPLWLRDKPISEIVELVLLDMVNWDDSGFPASDPRSATAKLKRGGGGGGEPPQP